MTVTTPRRPIPAALLPLLLALVVNQAGCDRAGPATVPASQASALPTVSMRIGSKTYTLEVAADEETRQRGLMDRPSMPADRGMIFVFPTQARRGFWMKNTLIPLDILYLDRAGRVVSVHRMEPHDEESTYSDGPAQFAVELNAGEAEACGVKPGYLLQIPAPARLARD